MRLMRVWVVLLCAGNVLFIYGYLGSTFDIANDGIEVKENIDTAAINGGISLLLFGVLGLTYDILVTQYRNQPHIKNQNTGIQHHNTGKNQEYQGQQLKIVQVEHQGKH
jgi:hypothetical protein